MRINRASEMEILYFQLYLLSLGCDGLLNNIKAARETEPYATLDKHFGYIWGKAASEENSVLDDYLEDENLIIRTDPGSFRAEFTETLNRAGRSSIYRLTTLPDELSDLLYRLSGFKHGMEIYSPYAGLAQLSSEFLAGDSFYGEESDGLVWGIGILRMHVDGCPSKNYILGDSPSKKWDKRFDIITAISLDHAQLYWFLSKDLPYLLNEKGTCIILSPRHGLFHAIADAINDATIDKKMLDMVVALPDNIMNLSFEAPAIIRLKSGRRPSDPVSMVDASMLFNQDIRGRNLIDTERIIKAIEDKSPEHVAFVPFDKMNKGYSLDSCLYPSLYITQYVSDGDKEFAPLKEFGEVLHLNEQNLKEGTPIPYVTVKDLSTLPNHRVYPWITEYRSKNYYHALIEPALLIAKSGDRLKFGYVSECSPDNPVYLTSTIVAFRINEGVSWEYIAAALSEATLTTAGTSAFRFSYAHSMIPKIPETEQRLVVRRVLDKLAPNKKNSSASMRRIPVALVGINEIDDKTKRLDVVNTFDNNTDAEEWIGSHSDAVEAVIVNHGDGITSFKALLLCTAIKDKPIFFVTSQFERLSELFTEEGKDAILKDRCFNTGSVDLLIDSLIETVDRASTPIGLIRRSYSKQLEEAANLDKKFRYKNLKLCDELEDLLVKITNNETCGIRTRIRIIRDNCFLQPLIDYKFLPPKKDKEFEYGAEVDFIANRCYTKGDNAEYILVREILPDSDSAKLLQTTKSFLNTGSHEAVVENSDVLLSCLLSITAALSHLNKMVQDNYFNDKDSDKGYYSIVTMSRFKTGKYLVRKYDKKDDYLYADNIHLNEKVCKDRKIREGDIVEIFSAGFEGKPVFDDPVTILFHTKDFRKVPPQDS